MSIFFFSLGKYLLFIFSQSRGLEMCNGCVETLAFPCQVLCIALTFCFLSGRNPLYLGIIFVAFLVGKALWVQLDISGEFRNGAVSGKHRTLLKLSYMSVREAFD